MTKHDKILKSKNEGKERNQTIKNNCRKKKKKSN